MPANEGRSRTLLARSRRLAVIAAAAVCVAAAADSARCDFGPPHGPTPVSEGKTAEALRKALAADPENAPAHFALGNVLAAQGKPALTEAVMHLFETVRICPATPEVRVRLARVLADSGDIDASVAQLQEACRRWPQDAALHELLGNGQLRAKQHAKALESYGRALELDPQRPGARYGRGMALLGLSLQNEATAEFEAAVIAAPAHAMAHLELGKIVRQRGDTKRAEAHLRTAIANRPDLAGPHLELAHLYRDQKRSAEAEAEFRAVLRLEPRQENALYALAQLVQARGDREEAARLFADFSRLRESRTAAISVIQANTLNTAGLQLMSSGALDQALASFRRALELEPTFATAAYNVGAVLAKQGKTQEAIQAFRKAIDLRPASPMPHYALGILLRLTGDPRAGEELRRAHLLNQLAPVHPPNRLPAPAPVASAAACDDESAKHPIERLILAGQTEEARRRLSRELPGAGSELRTYVEAHILFKERRFAESIQLLQSLFESEGGRTPGPDVFALIGLNHVQMDDLKLAEPFLVTAAEKCPDSYRARFHLALLYYTTNRFADAERELRQVIQLKRDFPKAYEILGLTLEELAKRDDAIGAYRESIALVEGQKLKDGSPYLSLGKFLLSLGKADESVPLLETAVKLAPESAEAAYWLGKSMHQLKRFEQAEQALLKSTRLDPNHAPAHYVLSRVYIAQGRADEAARAIETFRQLEAAGRKTKRPVTHLSP